MNKILVGIGVILVLVVAWILISPLFIVTTADDPIPEALITEPEVVIEQSEAIAALPEELQEEMEAGGFTEEDLSEEFADEEMPELVEMQDPTYFAELQRSPRYRASGSVRTINTEDGRVLRFEDYMVQNGPDIFVYLATDDGADDFVDLGKVKATSGNVNYDIPDDVDLEKYDTVLIWCRAFSVLFASADLVEE